MTSHLEDNLSVKQISLHMKPVVTRLTSTIVLSAVLSVLVVIDASATDIGKLTETCTNCHGKDGASTESDVPIIGGFSEQYLLDSMETYKNKERPCPETEYREGKNKGSKTDMCKVVNELNDQDTQAIAKFYASKKFTPAKQKFDAEKAKLGKKIQKKCRKCHTDGGSEPEDDAGILAGQWSPYIRQQFKDYSSGKRLMTKKMKEKYKKLDETDFENLIHYFASPK